MDLQEQDCGMDLRRQPPIGNSNMDMVGMAQDPFAVSSGGEEEVLKSCRHHRILASMSTCSLKASVAGIRNFSPAETKIGHLAV